MSQVLTAAEQGFLGQESTRRHDHNQQMLSLFNEYNKSDCEIGELQDVSWRHRRRLMSERHRRVGRTRTGNRTRKRAPENTLILAALKDLDTISGAREPNFSRGLITSFPPIAEQMSSIF